MKNKSRNPDPQVTFIAQSLPLSALAARWRMPTRQLEIALRRHGGHDWNIQIELPPESGARALHAARRMLNESGDGHEF